MEITDIVGEDTVQDFIETPKSEDEAAIDALFQAANKCRPTTMPLPIQCRRTPTDTPLPLLRRRRCAPTETVTPLHPPRRRRAPTDGFVFLLANKQLTNNENPQFPGLQKILRSSVG